MLKEMENIVGITGYMHMYGTDITLKPLTGGMNNLVIIM